MRKLTSSSPQSLNRKAYFGSGLALSRLVWVWTNDDMHHRDENSNAWPLPVFLGAFSVLLLQTTLHDSREAVQSKEALPPFFLKIYTKNKNTHWKIFCSCCTSVYPRNSGLWEQSSAQITRQLHLYFHNCTKGFISKFRITFQRQICLPAIQSLSSSYLKRKSSAKMHPALHTSTEDM